MADLEGEYQEARMNGVREKHDICRRAPCKTGAHEKEAACKRVRAELDSFKILDGCVDHNRTYGEEGETNSPKRLKGVIEQTIKIPGGHAYASEDLQYPVSDAELGKMSEAMGRNWQFIGLSVGLENSDIEQCEENNPRNVQLQIYEMLLRWKRAYSERATMCALIQAIMENNVSVSWKKFGSLSKTWRTQTRKKQRVFSECAQRIF